MANSQLQNAVSELKDMLANLSPNEEAYKIFQAKDPVLKRYQPLFSLNNIDKLTKEEFYSFLLFKNNKHWNGLHRAGNTITSDMMKLKESLTILLNEKIEIQERLNKVLPMVSGMGRALITAILLIVDPTKYGVLNNTSEEGLKKLKLWPKFERGESFGSKYVKINKVLEILTKELKIDFWVLDSLWWVMASDQPIVDNDDDQTFGLERHLHEFLRDNWERISLGKEWDIYSEPEDAEMGYEYPTDIGRIDILAKHKKEKKWLVIELKRNQSSDTTVGQILRYMSWVIKNLATKVDKVEGLIISKTKDKQLDFALDMVSDVDVYLYEVEFKLKKLNG